MKESFDPTAAACELDRLTLASWRGDKTAAGKYRAICKTANENGFKVKWKRVSGKVVHSLASLAGFQQTDINGVKFYGKSKTKLASMLIYTGKPVGFKCPSGCCSTRAMSYVLKGMKFEEIYAKQLKIGTKHSWNRTSTIKKIMEKYGDFSCIDVTVIPSCRHNRSAASIAARLFSIKSPIAFETTSHMAAIDNSREVPCVVDSWDSRNKRVELLYVKKQDASRALKILTEL